MRAGNGAQKNCRATTERVTKRFSAHIGPNVRYLIRSYLRTLKFARCIRLWVGPQRDIFSPRETSPPQSVNPLCPYGMAYRKVDGSSVSGLLKIPL